MPRFFYARQTRATRRKKNTQTAERKIMANDAQRKAIIACLRKAIAHTPNADSISGLSAHKQTSARGNSSPDVCFFNVSEFSRGRVLLRAHVEFELAAREYVGVRERLFIMGLAVEFYRLHGLVFRGKSVRYDFELLSVGKRNGYAFHLRRAQNVLHRVGVERVEAH